MTTRRAASVIVKVVTTDHDGGGRTLLYGPFLPHRGAAVRRFVDQIEARAEQDGSFKSWEISVEDVFIGDGESDCVVQGI